MDQNLFWTAFCLCSVLDFNGNVQVEYSFLLCFDFKYDSVFLICVLFNFVSF